MYERFSKVLQEKGLTAYKVSKETGVSQGSLSDWKYGRSKPKNESMKKIADYLGVSVDWLNGISTDRYETAKTKITDDDIKFALFGGEKEITDEMYEEVKSFAQYVKEKYKNKKE